MIAKAG